MPFRHQVFLSFYEILKNWTTLMGALLKFIAHEGSTIMELLNKSEG